MAADLIIPPFSLIPESTIAGDEWCWLNNSDWQKHHWEFAKSAANCFHGHMFQHKAPYSKGCGLGRGASGQLILGHGNQDDLAWVELQQGLRGPRLIWLLFHSQHQQLWQEEALAQLISSLFALIEPETIKLLPSKPSLWCLRGIPGDSSKVFHPLEGDSDMQSQFCHTISDLIWEKSEVGHRSKERVQPLIHAKKRRAQLVKMRRSLRRPRTHRS